MTAMLRWVLTALPVALFASPCALADGMSDGVELRQAVDGVTIYTVHDDDEILAEEEAVAPTINVNTSVSVVIVRRSSRWDRYRRALGQRYTGFIRVYAGPQYPF